MILGLVGSHQLLCVDLPLGEWSLAQKCHVRHLNVVLVLWEGCWWAAWGAPAREPAMILKGTPTQLYLIWKILPTLTLVLPSSAPVCLWVASTPTISH